MLIYGLAFAVVSSLALNAGYLLQHLGVAAAPSVDARAPIATLRGLLRSRMWLVGTGVNLFGSVLHIAALAAAPISLVQAFSAGGLALVVPASARVARSPLHRAERVAVSVIVAALAILAARPGSSSTAPSTVGGPLLVLGAGVAFAAMLAGARGSRRGAGLALAAGTLYGLSDAATKGFTDAAGHGLLAAVVGPWPPVIVVLCLAAFFALQRGLQLGAAATAIVLMTAATNVVAVAAGVAVFAESFGTGDGVAWVHTLAMAAIAAASWRLVGVQARIGPPPPRDHRRRATRANTQRRLRRNVTAEAAGNTSA